MLPHILVVFIVLHFVCCSASVCLACLSLLIFGRWEVYVQSQLEGVVYHPGKQRSEQSTRLFKARISIDLYQPRAQLIIYHEVIPKYFKRMFFRIWIEPASVNTLESHFYYVQYTTVKYLVKINGLSCLFLYFIRCLLE